MNLEKEFIPHTEALELKELGFDEPCLAWFAETKVLQIAPETYKKWTNKLCNNSSIIKVFNTDCVTAPTFSQTFRWFREKYELFGEVIMYIPQEGDLDGCFTYVFSISSVENYTKKAVVNRKYYTSYEEAELACLKKLIEIVKSQK